MAAPPGPPSVNHTWPRAGWVAARRRLTNTPIVPGTVCVSSRGRDTVAHSARPSLLLSMSEQLDQEMLAGEDVSSHEAAAPSRNARSTAGCSLSVGLDMDQSPRVTRPASATCAAAARLSGFATEKTPWIGSCAQNVAPRPTKAPPRATPNSGVTLALACLVAAGSGFGAAVASPSVASYSSQVLSTGA